jgi:hypothetical protein
MHSKLAGHLPLQDMIAQTLESARSKIAAAEEKDNKVKKLVEYEKKEHGGKIPSVKEEEEEHEKKSSVLDFSDPDDMSKLASALDELGEELLKEADSIENGKESHQGGQQLATMSPVGGKQVYTGAKAKHQVPTSTGMQADPSQGKASTQVPNDHARAPGGTGAKYPAKGVLKTAEFPPKKEEKGEEKSEKKAPPFAKKEEKGEDEKKEKKSGVAALQAVVEKVAEEKTAMDSNTAGALAHLAVQGAGGAVGYHAGKAQAGRGEKHTFGGKQIAGALFLPGGLGYQAGRAAGHSIHAKGDSTKEKKSEAVDFILAKLAEFHGGGETLDDKAAPVPSNEGRQLIANNKAPVSATKREAKGPGRKQLSEVLSEPAQTKSTDSTVQDNLRNAAKGGVKIAAVKDYLRKIAEAGCVCAGAGECDYCRMKASVDKKRADKKVKQSLGMPPSGPAPSAGGPMGGSPGGM